MDTKEVIIGMLTENTGQHMLDSGGAYGRNWQRNQGVDWDSTPEFVFDEYGATINVYHYLVDNLVFAEDWNAHWEAFRDANPDEYDWSLMSDWVEAIGGSTENEVGEFNTYNWENDLSQVLQGITFTLDTGGSYREGFVILQVHGGADVRGGYTAPKVFRTMGEYFPALASWHLECDNGHTISGGQGETLIDGYSGVTWQMLDDTARAGWVTCPAEDCDGKLLTGKVSA